MRVCPRIHRHAVDPGGKVGPVVEIETTEVILVRLAVAAVLADDQSGNELEDLAGPQQRPVLDQLRGDRPLARGVGRPDAVVVMAGHDGGRELALRRLCRAGGGRLCCGMRRAGEGCRDHGPSCSSHQNRGGGLNVGHCGKPFAGWMWCCVCMNNY